MTRFHDLMRYAKTGIAHPDMTGFDKLKALALFPQSYPSQTITGIPPLTFKANGKPLASWSISGQTVQNGTPTPDAPIMPEFVGERTENLFEFGAFVSSITSIRGNGTFTAQNGELSITSNELQDAYTIPFVGSSAGVYKIPVSPNTQYSVYAQSSNIQCVVFENGQTGTGQIHAWNGGSTTFTTLSSTTFVTIRFGIHANLPLGTTGKVKNIILNTGSTAKPYEPYGYKLPITCAGQTVPIYLGQVQTVRRIKKLVLTGEENFSIDTYLRFSMLVDDIKSAAASRTMRSYCSHYECLYHAEPYDNDWNNVYYQSGNTLYFHDRRFSAVADFKAYLAAQYAAGTPVIVWYVLSNEQTGIVNEPLCKIGDYTDIIASTNTGAPSIPTAKGQNTLSVGTTVQPSSVTITT